MRHAGQHLLKAKVKAFAVWVLTVWVRQRIMRADTQRGFHKPNSLLCAVFMHKAEPTDRALWVPVNKKATPPSQNAVWYFLPKITGHSRFDATIVVVRSGYRSSETANLTLRL